MRVHSCPRFFSPREKRYREREWRREEVCELKEKKKNTHTLSEKKVGEKEEEGVFLSLFLLSFVRP